MPSIEFSDEAKAEYVEFVHSIEERDDLGEDLADDETTGFAVGASMKGFEETNGTILPNDGSGDGTANPAEQTLGLGHWASLNDHKSVKFCLEKQKLNPDECDADGLTPLMRAADRDATDAMQLLLEAGASTDPVDEDGCTALHYAAICDHTGAATMLARYGADPNALNNDGESALELASDVLRTAIEKARREHIDGNVSAPVSSTAGWTVQVSRVSALVVVSVIVALAAIGIATLVGRNSVPYADTNEGGAR